MRILLVGGPSDGVAIDSSEFHGREAKVGWSVYRRVGKKAAAKFVATPNPPAVAKVAERAGYRRRAKR